MSQSFELSSSTLARLQAHAVPLVDNIESIINRLIDFYESAQGAPVPASPAGDFDRVRQFNPSAPPDLTHTKVLAIEFGGKLFDRSQTNWNGLLNAAVREAKIAAKSADEFKRLVVVNFADGQKKGEGYRYLPDAGISIQGQDANGAWKAAFHIVQQLGCSLMATFVWREKESAAFPGMTGRFSIANILPKKHGIGQTITGIVRLALPVDKTLTDAVKQPSAATSRPAREGQRRGKNSAADELAATGVMPEKPIVTSETNQHRQKHFDELAKAAEEGRWEDVAAKHMGGIDTYARMINRYRDRLLAAHGAQLQQAVE